MVEMARRSPNLDNLMNERSAFVIDRFQVSLPDCPIGRRPVMIGRRKPAYNKIGKVMGRLNRIMMVLETMRHMERQATQPAAVPTGRKRRRVCGKKKKFGGSQSPSPRHASHSTTHQ